MLMFLNCKQVLFWFRSFSKKSIIKFSFLLIFFWLHLHELWRLTCHNDVIGLTWEKVEIFRFEQKSETIPRMGKKTNMISDSIKKTFITLFMKSEGVLFKFEKFNFIWIWNVFNCTYHTLNVKDEMLCVKVNNKN